MDEEAQLTRELERAHKARVIYESEFFAEALDTVKEHFLMQFLGSKSDESEFRDLCYRSIKCVDLFEQVFVQALETGQFAEKQLEDIKRNKDKFIGGDKDPYGAIV